MTSYNKGLLVNWNRRGRGSKKSKRRVSLGKRIPLGGKVVL